MVHLTVYLFKFPPLFSLSNQGNSQHGYKPRKHP
uniref:Uncharacterized protein n=1 Tax=Anguilla anguilla TaxID=7936 RepID=A0A0E9QRC2_ANGAN